MWPFNLIQHHNVIDSELIEKEEEEAKQRDEERKRNKYKKRFDTVLLRN